MFSCATGFAQPCGLSAPPVWIHENSADRFLLASKLLLPFSRTAKVAAVTALSVTLTEGSLIIRRIVPLAVVCVVGWAAASQAHAGRFLHHHSHMTVAQKVRYFERSVAQDRQAIRWLQSRYAPRTLQRVDEISWSRHALRWHLALLRQYRSKLEPRYTDLGAWLCIHSKEGAWNDPNAPYYGGLQMDYGFMQTYGPELLASKGTADKWTPAEQIMVARRARDSGRGYYPWPNTARACGLI